MRHRPVERVTMAKKPDKPRIGRPPSGNMFTHTIHIKATDSEIAVFRAYAAAKSMSMSAWLRSLARKETGLD
jgi:hypothetical protein